MFLNYNRATFLQRCSVLFVLFSLFFSSALFARNITTPVSVEELLFEKEELLLGKTADQSQKAIINSLELYLETVSPRSVAFTEKEGCCYSLSVLWLYHKWLDNQHERTNEYAGNWFNKTVKTHYYNIFFCRKKIRVLVQIV